MANFLQETNLAITKFNLNKAGELTDLEINGKNIELGNEVKVHLYAWTNEEGTDPIWAYTLSETPAVGGTAIMPDAATLALEDDSISAIGEDTITAFSTEFTRDNTKDIEF